MYQAVYEASVYSSVITNFLFPADDSKEVEAVVRQFAQAAKIRLNSVDLECIFDLIEKCDSKEEIIVFLT